MPVAAVKSAIAARKPVSSPPVHWLWTETFVPLYGLSAPSALSSSVLPVGTVGRFGSGAEVAGACVAAPVAAGPVAAGPVAAGPLGAVDAAGVHAPTIRTTTANTAIILGYLPIDSNPPQHSIADPSMRGGWPDREVPIRVLIGFASTSRAMVAPPLVRCGLVRCYLLR